MPKMKTHRAASRRMRKTGTGKIVRKRANFRHILEKKNSKRKRRLGKTVPVAKADERRARRLLGG
ncbi:MAG TPA: 50S ribosomal protein L35 [Actinomycetota bacterium]|nr:50S ribosomal protein L35 [Actinomycetota bacterium]